MMSIAGVLCLCLYKMKLKTGENEEDYCKRRYRNLLQRLGTGQPIFFHHGWPLSGDD
jgi:hypothetical protein